MSIDQCPVCITMPIDKPGHLVSWVQCDVCRQWFHTNCIHMTSAEINNLHSYHCKPCTKVHGPSVFKRKLKRARVKIDYIALNEGETFAVDKSVHPHVPTFLDFEPSISANTVSGPDSRTNPYIDVLHSQELSKKYALASKLPRPVLIAQATAESGMQLPQPSNDITVQYITDHVGDETAVEVMDVLSQQGVRPGWKMAQWRDYFYTDPGSRDRIYNVISLEVSDADGLGRDFVRPAVVRDMDLVDKVWPDDDPQPRPKVTTYCLMSVAGSYTDFHIDFSGTCVYYTVCRGAKSFLMYPPTDENLNLYAQWCLEPNQNFLWFGDYCKAIGGKLRRPTGGFRVTLQKDDLFIIPSGWIHSVYTPQDSVVVGGNYLLVSTLVMHLKITDIERQTKVPSKFRFPMFNKVLWLTAYYYLHHKDEFVADTVGVRKRLKQESTDSCTPSVLPNDRLKQESADPCTPSLPPNGSKQESTDSVDKTKQEPTDTVHRPADSYPPSTSQATAVLLSLIDQLNYHHNLSKSNQAAHKSIPFHLIGKDPAAFVAQLERWLGELTDAGF